MYISVTCANDDTVVAIQQEITVESISEPRPSPTKRRASNAEPCAITVGDIRSMMHVVFDVAVHPIDRRSEKRAQNKCEQHPVFEKDIRQQHEEIETDVLVKERIVGAVGNVIEKLQDGAPIAHFRRGSPAEQANLQRPR